MQHFGVNVRPRGMWRIALKCTVRGQPRQRAPLRNLVSFANTGKTALSGICILV